MPFTQVPFKTIAKGYRSGVREPLQTVVGNQTDWQSLWKRHTSIGITPAPPPSVDFDREMVVGVFAGEKPTGGYDVEIINAEQTDSAVTVHYREKSPPPGSIVTQALTQPFHLIRLARNESLTVRFRRAP